MQITAQLDCPLHDSFRVQQIGGMFDVPMDEKLTECFHAEVPDVSEAWRIGLIVGPSGSGKSTIARHVFGDALHVDRAWPEKAVIDGVGEMSTKKITSMFTSVGFSSPPSWIKPYHVLSRGEQFRCDLVRALADGLQRKDEVQSPNEATLPLVAFDEFTSVVDRNVARIGSAAVASAIRSDRIGVRFVGVTCHYDVIPWLAPDWVVDMSTGRCDWRCLRRPEIRLKLFRARRSTWRMFARHHYLSGSLSVTARCFVAYWQDVPVCFCATLPIIGRRGHWRITRIVTLPDYQGVGIGMRVAEAVADLHRAEGHRLNITASHPVLVAHCERSTKWRAVYLRKTGSGRGNEVFHNYRGSAGRAVVSFEYLGMPTSDVALENDDV
jgi:GNAT superfamily N-acetyltransferase